MDDRMGLVGERVRYYVCGLFFIDEVWKGS